MIYGWEFSQNWVASLKKLNSWRCMFYALLNLKTLYTPQNWVKSTFVKLNFFNLTTEYQFHTWNKNPKLSAHFFLLLSLNISEISKNKRQPIVTCYGFLWNKKWSIWYLWRNNRIFSSFLLFINFVDII